MEIFVFVLVLLIKYLFCFFDLIFFFLNYVIGKYKLIFCKIDYYGRYILFLLFIFWLCKKKSINKKSINFGK